jgi:hypothetical protein
MFFGLRIGKQVPSMEAAKPKAVRVCGELVLMGHEINSDEVDDGWPILQDIAFVALP